MLAAFPYHIINPTYIHDPYKAGHIGSLWDKMPTLYKYWLYIGKIGNEIFLANIGSTVANFKRPNVEAIIHDDI